MPGMSDEALAAIWRGLMEDHRRGRPERLQERMRAAVDAAARAGSWVETLRTRFTDAPEAEVHRVPARRPS